MEILAGILPAPFLIRTNGNKPAVRLIIGVKEMAEITKRRIRYSILLLAFLVAIPALVYSARAGSEDRIPSDLEIPTAGTEFGSVPEKFTEYQVILEPDQNKPEWWAGAPSVVRDSRGIFWLACRMRTAEAPRGLRGYEIRILKSSDGVHFEKVVSIPREQVPIPGFERPSLLIDPQTGKFKLYGCGPWENGPWSIIKFADAADPSEFIPKSAKPVIEPIPAEYARGITVDGLKDPVIIHANDLYHCYAIGYLRRLERIYHFTSKNGEDWTPAAHPNESIMDLSGWHDFFVRPASIVPLGAGYLFVYEGSNTKWYDPVYNIATGLGFTFDLHNIIDLTPGSPLAISTTPGRFHTWRYSDWIEVDNELWVYAEVARRNDSNEIRLFKLTKK